MSTSITIGRATDNKWVVTSSQASKHHARAYLHEGRVYIEDLNSTNGTLVNGHPVRKSVIVPNDTVTLGTSTKLDVAELYRRLGATCATQAGSSPGADRNRATRPPDLPSADGATIGRSSDNRIVVNDPQVSRHHAVVEREGGSWMIRDLGSANGTFVNGKRVRKQVLSPGDKVRMGSCDVSDRLQDMLGGAAPRGRVLPFGARKIPAWGWGLAAAASVLLICGIALATPLATKRYQEYSDFMVAQQANSEQAYKQFMDAHPDSSYFAQADVAYKKLREVVAQAAFLDAQQKNTIEAWDNVAREYQDVQWVANSAMAQKTSIQTQIDAKQNQDRWLQEMQNRETQYQQACDENKKQLASMQQNYESLAASQQSEKQRLMMEMENMRAQNATQARVVEDQRALAEKQIAISQQGQNTASTAQNFRNAIDTANCVMGVFGGLQALSQNAR